MIVSFLISLITLALKAAVLEEFISIIVQKFSKEGFAFTKVEFFWWRNDECEWEIKNLSKTEVFLKILDILIKYNFAFEAVKLFKI